jgi:hypothetical protein
MSKKEEKKETRKDNFFLYHWIEKRNIRCLFIERKRERDRERENVTSRGVKQLQSVNRTNTHIILTINRATQHTDIY